MPLERALVVVALVATAGCYRSHDPLADAGPIDAVALGPRSGPGRVSCAPGATVTIACGSRGLGSCSGDPVLLVCDGARVEPDRCVDDSAAVLGINDDDSGLCSGLEVRCPSSGQLAVRARPFSSGSFECRWDVRTGR